MGEDKQTGTLLSIQAATMVRLAWAKPLLSAAPQSPIGEALNPPCKGNIRVQNGVQGGAQSNRDSNSLQCFRCQGWGPHGQGVHYSGQSVKQGWGDPRECSQTPLQQPTVSSKHSLCDPKPKPTQVKAVNRKGWKGITPILFLNPDPIA